MTGGTLTIVFLSQWKWSHELKQVAERTHKTGRHIVPGRNVKKSQESCPVPVSALSVNKEREKREQDKTQKTARVGVEK